MGSSICCRRPRSATLRNGVAIILSAFLGVLPCPSAAADPCLAAAEHAALARDVPLPLMLAIARVETGRREDGGVTSWPWVLNVAGRGIWAESRQEALATARRLVADGALGFDIGCFQINHRWHGDAFPSLEEMIDPVENADYAARFLSELHQETGDWLAAAGLYHSRTPGLAEEYRRLVIRAMARDGFMTNPMPFATRTPSAGAAAADSSNDTAQTTSPPGPLIVRASKAGRLTRILPSMHMVTGSSGYFNSSVALPRNKSRLRRQAVQVVSDPAPVE